MPDAKSEAIATSKRIHRLEGTQELVVWNLAVAIFIEELHYWHNLVVGQTLLENFVDALEALDKFRGINEATADPQRKKQIQSLN